MERSPADSCPVRVVQLWRGRGPENINTLDDRLENEEKGKVEIKATHTPTMYRSRLSLLTFPQMIRDFSVRFEAYSYFGALILP